MWVGEPIMTAPRIVEPGLTVMVTRRVVCRFYLLRPDHEMAEAFLYCLGVAAQKNGIILHAACVLSTHVHIVFTDPRGVYPDFFHDLFRLLANFTKVHRGWGHEVFNAAGPSAVLCRTADAVIDKCAYSIANPVECRAVRYARDWPGFCTRVEDIGTRKFVAARPKKYFDAEGDMPERVEVRFELPEKLVELYGVEEAREKIAEELRAKEKKAQDEARARGEKFLGAERVLKASPFRRAKSYEVFGALNPTFATKGGGKQAYIEEVERLRTFRVDYRDAWERWRAGQRDVCFPYGTWLMRVRYHVRRVEAPG